MDIFDKISQNREQGKAFVIATLVSTKGHTPRQASAKMIVYADSSIDGTIGGGNFEKLVIDDCLSLFKSDESNLLKSYLMDTPTAGLASDSTATSMVCGGEGQVFMELFAAPENLIIFGGGHVCRALTEVAAGLNFNITIVDNRPEILQSYKLPIRTILTDESFTKDLPVLNINSYIIIVTHGHQHDQDVLGKVITQDCAYIGMIGSKKKIGHTYAQLEQQGIDKSLFAKVHSPIGLAIGAEGPHEIAIAIAAELIGVRRKRLS